MELTNQEICNGCDRRQDDGIGAGDNATLDAGATEVNEKLQRIVAHL